MFIIHCSGLLCSGLCIDPTIVIASSLIKCLVPYHQDEADGWNLSDDDLPDYKSHFLIFHRGTSVDRVTAVFFWDKIEFMAARARDTVTRLFRCCSGSASDDVEASGVSSKPSALFSSQWDVRYVQRISMEDTWVNRRNILQWYLSPITLQEPTFERLVLLYATKKQISFTVDDATAQKAAAPPSAHVPSRDTTADSDDEESDDESDKSRKSRSFSSLKHVQDALQTVEDEESYDLHIKYFKDIPMADLEVVYPATQV